MTSVSTILLSIVSLMGLVVLYFWLYRDYRLDLFRDQLFALRDELFDLAASGKIDFDSKAYGMLRTTLNGFIRFSHRFGVTTVAWAASNLTEKRLNEAGVVSFHDSWEEAKAELAPDVREQLDAILVRMHFVIADQMVFTSGLVLLLVPVICLLLAQYGGRRMMEWGGTLRAWVRSHFLDPVSLAALSEGAAG